MDYGKFANDYSKFKSVKEELNLKWDELKCNLLDLKTYMKSLGKGLNYRSIINFSKILRLVNTECMDSGNDYRIDNMYKNYDLLYPYAYVSLNKILCDCAYYDILLNDFNKLAKCIPEYNFYKFPSYPLFFYKLINSKRPSISNFEGGFETAKR